MEKKILSFEEFSKRYSEGTLDMDTPQEESPETGELDMEEPEGEDTEDLMDIDTEETEVQKMLCPMTSKIPRRNPKKSLKKN